MLKLEDYIVASQLNDVEDIIFNDKIDEGKIMNGLKKLWDFITGKNRKRKNNKLFDGTVLHNITWTNILTTMPMSDKLKYAKGECEKNPRIKLQCIKDDDIIVAIMVYLEQSKIDDNNLKKCPYIIALQVDEDYTDQKYLKHFVEYLITVAVENDAKYILISDVEYKSKKYWRKTKYTGTVSLDDDSKKKAYYYTLDTITSRINEDFDDNIFWLLDKWFEMNPNQLSDFIGICTKCKSDRVPNVQNISKYLEGTELGKCLPQFIDFIENSVTHLDTRNDIESLRIIINQVMNHDDKYILK